MSEIDAKSLTVEERAIVDAAFLHRWDELGFAIVAAMRALFAPAASKTESTDPDCNPHDHSWSYGYCHTCHLMGRPQPASKAEKWTGDVKCPDCGRLVNEAHCGGTNHAYQRVKPAPPEPTAPKKLEKVREVLGMMHDGGGSYYSTIAAAALAELDAFERGGGGVE